jgi:hypothetical protein
MSWAVRPGVDGGAVVTYESALTELARPAFTGMCEFDRRVFPPELFARLVAAHPLTVLPVPGALHVTLDADTLRLAGDADLATRCELELALRDFERALRGRPEPQKAPAGSRRPGVVDLTGLGFIGAYCACAVLRIPARTGACVTVRCTPGQYRLLMLCGAAETHGVVLRVA